MSHTGSGENPSSESFSISPKTESSMSESILDRQQRWKFEFEGGEEIALRRTL